MHRSYLLPNGQDDFSFKDNSSFDGTLVPNTLQRLVVVLELEYLVDDTLYLDFPGIKVIDSSG